MANYGIPEPQTRTPFGLQTHPVGGGDGRHAARAFQKLGALEYALDAGGHPKMRAPYGQTLFFIAMARQRAERLQLAGRPRREDGVTDCRSSLRFCSKPACLKIATRYLVKKPW
ncbi:MAG: hypothetical protein HY231_01460 [Acidobacteria bacterium]|nr:hypothetical protein [Acidobacteriota bacterium]